VTKFNIPPGTQSGNKLPLITVTPGAGGFPPPRGAAGSQLSGSAGKAGVSYDNDPTLARNQLGRWGTTLPFNSRQLVASPSPETGWQCFDVDRPTIIKPVAQPAGILSYAYGDAPPQGDGSRTAMDKALTAIGPGLCYLWAPGRWWLHYLTTSTQYTATTIAAAAGNYNDTAAQFVIEGFAESDTVEVSGFVAPTLNGRRVIKSGLVAATMFIAPGNPTTEAAGASVTITVCNPINVLQIACEDPVMVAAILAEPGFMLESETFVITAAANTSEVLLPANRFRRGFEIVIQLAGGNITALGFGTAPDASAGTPLGTILVGQGASYGALGPNCWRGVINVASTNLGQVVRVREWS
jgi:hypothetical protein